MTELRFACTACGKCCTDPPEMTVLEAVRLGDVFVPALVYRLTSVPRDDNEAGLASLSPHPDFAGMDSRRFVAALRESTAVRAAGATVSEPGWDHYVAVTVRPWTYPAREGDRFCPALGADRKQCTIYERRPYTCRTIPARYDVPDALLVPAFRGFVDRGLASTDRYECDVSPSAPAILRGETDEDASLVDASYLEARKAGRDAAMADKPLAARILSSPLLPPLRELFPQLRRAGLLAVSFHGALASAHDLGLVDDAGVRAFCSAQIALIEREIAAAVERKRKEDRDTTGRFRTLLAAYGKMLEMLAPDAV
ncbi:MAG TPA: YkgJ family cysteine cluster protein [Polyangiaceae bacterium]|nr:YkgJ family cysteine cluster protein [Polyangiaceae bacterium]